MLTAKAPQAPSNQICEKYDMYGFIKQIFQFYLNQRLISLINSKQSYKHLYIKIMKK